MKRLFVSFIVFCFFCSTALGYTTYQTTDGPLKLYFGEPGSVMKLGTITELDKPLTVRATFENQSERSVSLQLMFRTIETIEFPEAEQNAKDLLKRSLELGPKETKTVEVDVVALAGTYTAHYPVHLDVEWAQDGKSGKTNIVLVIETTVPPNGTPTNPLLGQVVDDPQRLPLNIMPQQGGLFLPLSDTYRGVWNYDGKPTEILPVGYVGGGKETGAHISRIRESRRGVARQSVCMHPPYRGGVGNVGVEYLIQMPETTPIELSFFSAMRDTVPPETPSDGVTFRVLVDGQSVYEKHHAETAWAENRVDMSRFAGKKIVLRLESDPGPKRSTNCDSCFWGDVMLFAGEKPPVLDEEEKRKLFAENLDALKTGNAPSEKTRIFQLDCGLTGAVTFGNNGFLDGVIGVGNREKQVRFDGLRLWCQGRRVGDPSSAIATGRWISKNEQGEEAPPKPQTRVAKRTRFENSYAQEIMLEGRSGTLFFEIAKNGPALQFSIDASELDLIERIEFGPATHTADRVYYGHGYCIEEPKAFTAHAGGHNLSTSHVGIDFDNGLSVLQATSFPPDRFVVDPDRKLYTLSVHPSTTITLLPGLEGAIDCAVRFRPICGKVAAPGVPEKAGRFVFDIWGGSYAEHVKTIEHAIRYGLTDAQWIVHNWQRWGYDNRLPDIWPPNPHHGTLEEMRRALRLCDEHGIQYGVHDNYIDFYPDADEFGFDVTTFHAGGQPRKAWNNYGIEAQSYQFRPDFVQKFLERNLDMMIPQLPMSTYFVDVFTSIPPVDYYDREGNFHSRVESQAAWRKAFDTIRDRLSAANKHFKSATTSSEAGMDSLIGHLDGADCQFMLPSPEPGEFRIKIECKKWSRVPWFDAVHHTTFSLHGVGYSGRYEAQRGRAIHGIESDDYIVSEILTGHALMVDLAARYRGAVRKYWLAQDLVRHLADKEIVGVKFFEGDIERQLIEWNDGTKIVVNLGREDWDFLGPAFKMFGHEGPAEIVIPPYGYFAVRDSVTDRLESNLVRVRGRVVESSFKEAGGKKIHYVNARQKGLDGLQPAAPKLNSFEYLGENRFAADFAWDVKGTVSQDLCIFVHCAERRRNWHHKIKDAVLAGGFPKTPTTAWNGTVVTDKYAMTIPDDLPAGRYYLLVGLYDQKGNGRRARLIGLDAGADRYAVGWLNVERKDDKVSNIAMEPIDWNDGELFQRLLPPGEAVDFGICTTKGAFRIEIDPAGKTTTATPLPEEPATELALRIENAAKSVKAVDADGKELRDVPFRFHDGKVVFTTQPDEFSYKIVW